MKRVLVSISVICLSFILLFACALAPEPVPVPEISFADGAPLMPNVSPVIVLSGSDYDMGYQYFANVSLLWP